MQTTLLVPPGAPYPESGQMPAFDPALLERQQVDAHWIVRDGDGNTTARCSLWYRRAPTLPGERPGIIGHYAALDAASGTAVLARAGAELSAAGCTRAIGPMDADTWHAYRFVTAGESNARPFFLEPTQPPAWPQHWAAAGFTPLAGYHSTICENISTIANDPRLEKARRRAREGGIRLRSLDPARWEEELGRIYAVASVSFRLNFLYTPLPKPEFKELYQPLRPLLQPELVLMAEDETDRPVGFLLGLPDLLDPTRENCIMKTVAVLPEPACRGLGRLLLGRAHAAAETLGYRRAIHALMHDGNESRNLSTRFGSRLLRRYTLYSRPLP